MNLLRLSATGTRTSRALALCVLLTSSLTTALSQAEDLLITNIQGYSHSHAAPAGAAPFHFSALLIRDGKVLTTNAERIAALTNEHTQVIDGAGRTLLPGLIDAHGHLAGLAQSLASVDLRASQSVAQAVEAVAAFAPGTKGQWITGRGWNQENWPDKHYPNAAHLDALAIAKPIVLERVDGHALWVNSQALKLAGINRNTPDPAGGQIVRDAEGEATGILIDNAMQLINNKRPLATERERQQQLDAAFQHLLQRGLTGVHDAGVGQFMIDELSRRAQAGTLPLRVYAMLDGSSPELPRWLKAGPIQDHRHMLAIRSVKLFADGALGSRGAALLDDYADAPGNRGLAVTSQAALMSLFTQIDAAQFQICVHAIGDQGNRQVLDNFDQLFKRGGNRGLRHRVEHAQVVAPKDLPRLAQLNLIASMQPTHATSDMHMAEERLGQERLAGAYAWRTLLAAGTRMAFGSDFPVEPANPFYGIHAAVTRQNHRNQPEHGWRIDDAVSVSEAISLFTRDAAWAAHMETQVGTLETGQWADFILLDSNPYRSPPQQLWQTEVAQTWVAGERRWPPAQADR